MFDWTPHKAKRGTAGAVPLARLEQMMFAVDSDVLILREQMDKALCAATGHAMVFRKITQSRNKLLDRRISEMLPDVATVH